MLIIPGIVLEGVRHGLLPLRIVLLKEGWFPMKQAPKACKKELGLFVPMSREWPRVTKALAKLEQYSNF